MEKPTLLGDRLCDEDGDATWRGTRERADPLDGEGVEAAGAEDKGDGWSAAVPVIGLCVPVISAAFVLSAAFVIRTVPVDAGTVLIPAAGVTKASEAGFDVNLPSVLMVTMGMRPLCSP